MVEHGSRTGWRGETPGNLGWERRERCDRVRESAYMSARARLVVTAPAAVAGTFDVGAAGFRPAARRAELERTGRRGVSRALGNDGCSVILPNVGGNIALIDRGTCNFTVKVKNAQNAGAIAAIIVDNVAGGVAGMGGTDATIAIPSVRITLADGTAIRANLPATASLGLDAALRAGADSSGRLLKAFAPEPLPERLLGLAQDTTAS